MHSDRHREELVKKTLEKIRSMENMVEQPFYNLNNPLKVSVNIRIDNSVPHGLFKPDPKIPNGWIASEQTFRAMKKDIFALDENMLDLADNYTCTSCKTLLDRQFWHFCPHCGAQFLL
jgi:hypothetical protein